MDMPDVLVTDRSTWTLGPFQASLPGPLMLTLDLDGEVICGVSLSTGFCEKRIELSMEAHPWQRQILLADHLDPEAAFFGELVVVQTVESIAGIKLTERALAVRVILSEFSRILGHLGALMRVARACGAETAMHYILRDREHFLDLLELLTGSRFAPHFLRFGGSAQEMTDGFIERVVQVCDSQKVRLKEYNDVLTYSRTFLNRTANVGIMSRQLALDCGVTGPNLRACGVSRDLRKNGITKGYEKMDFDVEVGEGAAGTIGDSHDRVVVRLKEILQSIRILKQQADRFEGAHHIEENIRTPKDFRTPAGEAYSRVESNRGVLGCHIISDGQLTPRRVSFRTPSQASISVVPELLKGAMVSDVPVILATLDLSLSEVDK